MTRDLSRLLKPKSIAVVGGGFWGRNIVRECLKIGFSGEIWPIHPKADEVGGLPAFKSLAELPAAPDATFIGVNREATIDVVATLAQMRAGGAVCFASGFLESEAESGNGAELQSKLLQAAGQMPIIGPNCYGFLNYLDGAALWPDQHGGARVDRGVAIITQSSNIAINLTMQQRGLPIAYAVTAGNQAQTSLAQIGGALLQDERVTALGLHIEGIGDLRAFEALAKQAASLGKPIVALKVGASEQAQMATVSHTASIAGSDAGARALLARLGIGQVDSLTQLIETLKLLHVAGPLDTNKVASMSCSGGEASLMADTGLRARIDYPVLNDAQKSRLRDALGPMVALANPLDYHTYIWGDGAGMGRAFAAMMVGDCAIGCIVVDFPRTDRCSAQDWECVIEAAQIAQKSSGKPVALVASLPENLPEDIAQRLMTLGLLPMHGIDDTLAAIACAATVGRGRYDPVLLGRVHDDITLITEDAAKSALADHGLRTPNRARASTAEGAAEAAQKIGFPVVLKGIGHAHKSEHGAVRLNLTTAAEVASAAAQIGGGAFLVEEMINDTVAELLIGVLNDPVHGMVLTLAAGGVLTELWRDSTSVLLPASADDIRAALSQLRVSKLLNGYRGKPAANIDAVVEAVLAVQSYVTAEVETVVEVEINPLLCGTRAAIAVDALIRQGENP